jgi:hypothetical protein
VDEAGGGALDSLLEAVEELVGIELPPWVELSRAERVVDRLVGGKLPDPEALLLQLGNEDPEPVPSEQGGGGLGDGHVVMVLLTTTVTGGLLPWWSPSAPAAMPETRAETARSDRNERRCILKVDAASSKE